jgi:hypothetical protein
MIVTIDDDLSNLVLKYPENCNDMLYSGIYNNNDPLYIQTPRMTYEISESHATLFFNKEKHAKFFEFLKNIENKVCQLISDNSESWFESKISTRAILEDLFKSSIKVPSKLLDPLQVKVKLSKNDVFEVYNKKQKKLDVSVLKSEDISECTFLLLAKEVVISSTQANINWEITQAMVHKKKKALKGFGIRQEKVIQPIKVKNDDETVKIKLINE